MSRENRLKRKQDRRDRKSQRQSARQTKRADRSSSRSEKKASRVTSRSSAKQARIQKRSDSNSERISMRGSSRSQRISKRRDTSSQRIESREEKLVARKLFQERRLQTRKRAKALRQGTPGVGLTPLPTSFFSADPGSSFGDTQGAFDTSGAPPVSFGGAPIEGEPREGFLEDAGSKKFAIGTAGVVALGIGALALFSR